MQQPGAPQKLAGSPPSSLLERRLKRADDERRHHSKRERNDPDGNANHLAYRPHRHDAAIAVCEGEIVP